MKEGLGWLILGFFYCLAGMAFGVWCLCWGMESAVKSLKFWEKGADGIHVYLSPDTRWGQIVLGIFRRSTLDPHDFCCDVWRLPLTPILEEVLGHDGTLTVVLHPPWHLRCIAAGHVRRLLGYGVQGALTGSVFTIPRRVIALYWFAPRRRSTGFWVKNQDLCFYYPRELPENREWRGLRMRVPTAVYAQGHQRRAELWKEINEKTLQVCKTGGAWANSLHKPSL